MLKKEQKSGAITVEVAIGIALAVIVVIVALGLFSENLSNMVSSSGFANMFKNQNKTTYSSFDRDYTNSQVNVQLIGEQGLAMLRNIANNKAISQIDKYMSGVDTSVMNVNSIAYLAIAINSIVGSPDICVYMKKDSDKKCDQDGIGGYSYRIHLNGGSISINPEGGGISPRTPAIGGDFTGGASGVTINQINTSGTSSGTYTVTRINPMSPSYNPHSVDSTSIYTYIKNLSAFADESNTVYDPVILIKAVNAASTNSTSTAISQYLINNLLTNSVAQAFQYAHDECEGWTGDHGGAFSGEECGGSTSNTVESWVSTDGDTLGYVSEPELQQLNTDINAISNLISSSTQSPQEIMNTVMNSQYIPEIIALLRNDHKSNPTSCQLFTSGLADMEAIYNINIPIPACVPY